MLIWIYLAILIFRLLNMINKYYVKIAHGVIQIVVLILVSLGLASIFETHRIGKHNNLYSIHSWLGLTTLCLFFLQWVIGFVSFMLPKMSDRVKKAYLPHHRFFGLVIFGYSCTTCLIGLAETSIYDVRGYYNLTNEQKLANLFGGTIVIYATLVIYLATRMDNDKEKVVKVRMHVPTSQVQIENDGRYV